MKEFIIKLIITIVTMTVAILMWIAVFVYGTIIGFYASNSAQIVTATWLIIGANIADIAAWTYFIISWGC